MKTKLLKSFVASLIAVSLIGLSGCQNALEVNPTQSVEISQALTNVDDLNAFLTGTYSTLTAQGGAACNYILLPDLLAYQPGVVTFNGTFGAYGDLNQLGHITTNAEAQRVWGTSYNVINRANIVLANIAIAPAGTTRNRIQGEALALRAYAYFNLVRMFARQYDPATAATTPGVPLQLTAITDFPAASATRTPRASVQAVYTQIVNDLRQARQLLPLNQAVELVDRRVAYGLLARVHLQRGDAGDYALAGAYADSSISTAVGTGAGTLNAGPVTVFTTNGTPEGIWEIGQDATNNAGTDVATFVAAQIFGGRGDVSIDNVTALGFGGTDIRGLVNPVFNGAATGAHMFYEGVGLVVDPITTYKYVPSNPKKNVVVMRVAEMRLIRAECSVRTGTNIGGIDALTDVNAIRTRAGATALGAVTLADVFAERHRELFMEGQFLYDVLRRRVTEPSVTIRGGIDPFGTAGNAQKLILPIPQRERDLNANLTQNPGY